MEPTCAAKAMEWSVELEKGLRSKRRGDPIVAIQAMGPKLQKWSTEAYCTAEVSNMFGLVLGEDRAFANSILLRLADAFKTGNNHTRACILKVFLVELKNRRKKGKLYDGILSRKRVPNYLEMLRRVKIVFDKGGVEARALALRVLGCWADLGKDSAEMRYMILSALESHHVLEVKASLFAAGCFCELSGDFAHVILKLLVDIVASTRRPHDVKIASVRIFASMGCSSSIARGAYEAGKKLILDSPNEEIVTEMLFSLSKLASRSILVLDEQVDLLVSLLGRNPFSSIHAVALRCLSFLSPKAFWCTPFNCNIVKILINIVKNTNNLLDEALTILKKSCCYILCHMDQSEILELILVVENASRCHIVSKRYAALSLLVDITCNLKRMRIPFFCDSPELLSPHSIAENVALVPYGKASAPLPWRVALLVIDQISFLECQNLLKLLLLLVEEYPRVGLLAIDRFRWLMEILLGMQVNPELAGSEDEIIQTCKEIPIRSLCVHEFSEFNDGKEKFPIDSGLMACISRFLATCLDILDTVDFFDCQVVGTLQLLVGRLTKACISLPGISPFLLRSCLIWHGQVRAQGISHLNCKISSECLTLEFAKKMIMSKELWVAYKIGVFAACQGAWFVAVFTFQQLLDRVQLGPCHFWLKSLAQFAEAESGIQLLLFPRNDTEWLKTIEDNRTFCTTFAEVIAQESTCNSDMFSCSDIIAMAHRAISSSGEILTGAVTLKSAFYFQRWFLSLHAKYLGILVNIMGMLSSNIFIDETVENVVTQLEGVWEKKAQDMLTLERRFLQASDSLRRLAEELDLLKMSFMDMNYKGFRSITYVALGCSLLAFCATFVVYFPKLPNYETSKFSRNSRGALDLVQDLAQRLWHEDSKISKDLEYFSTIFGEVESFTEAGVRMSSKGCKERAGLDICRFSVSGVINLQAKAQGVKDEFDLFKVHSEGLKLMLDIIMKWIFLPSQIPFYFFQTRPCIGAEIFASNSDGGSPNAIITIPPGFQLSLNLCLQTKNMPSKGVSRIAKIYCIIAARQSDQIIEGNEEAMAQQGLGFCPSKTEEMLVLNKELLLYMKRDVKGSVGISEGLDNSGLVKSFVCFEPNGRGQGFSTSLLDVSNFPEGTYRSIWHSCCIDSKGRCWSLLPLNMGPFFSIRKPPPPA
ncbi:uncharacterized protein LOC18434199 isoform X2 [Amborella trichopoda]|uniref:uncharacterized protein LOC18434199 isoform X2 n=1 Tax=Amborella trichopoda TaxID=13333 RepID=UPI0009C18A46|nr:uncharacterized protein LOC18434199 isoform X2 [Amborella trichopoda]|eukprot:XP_020522863.1 uncharacterized protein LOC18434199 isoform X2 [Amborella trichopoda]